VTEEEFALAWYPLARTIAGAFASRYKHWIPKDDLAQIGIVAALAHFRRGGALDKKLLASVIRRQLIDAHRSEGKRGKRARDAAICPAIAARATLDPNPEAAAVRNADWARVLSITAGRERRVLEGSLAGETNTETGRAIGLKSVRVSQIRQQLIRKLAAFVRRAA
jgi:RNA polymerase sigma factor (sigma-70 family)